MEPLALSLVRLDITVDDIKVFSLLPFEITLSFSISSSPRSKLGGTVTKERDKKKPIKKKTDQKSVKKYNIIIIILPTSLFN